MIFKRIFLPGLLASAAYWALLRLGTAVSGRALLGLVLTLLSSYAIRVCDDIADYEEDCKKGKAWLCKKGLIALAVALFLAVLACSVAFSLYWWALPLAVIYAPFAVKAPFRIVFKPFFVPSILLALFHSALTYHPILPALIVAAILFDLVILWKKR